MKNTPLAKGGKNTLYYTLLAKGSISTLIQGPKKKKKAFLWLFSFLFFMGFAVYEFCLG
jgi:hypothetical protein